MVAWTLLWAVLVALLTTPARPTLYTSHERLEGLVTTEQELVMVLENAIESGKIKSVELKRLFHDTHEQYLRYRSPDETEADHPVQVLHMLGRFVDGWKPIHDNITEPELREELSSITGNWEDMPVAVDYKGACVALTRLQRVYNLHTDDLAEGNVAGRVGAPLTPRQFLDLGRQALDLGEPKAAFEWLTLVSQHTPMHIKEADLMILLARTHEVLKNWKTALSLCNSAVEQDPENGEYQNYVKHFQNTISVNGEGTYTDPAHWERPPYDMWDNYESLCRGDVRKDEARTARLHCRYVSMLLPYVRVKQELLNLSPQVGLFYDVVSDTEGHALKQLSAPQLFRAKVGDVSNAVESEQRVGELSWIWDTSSDPVVSKLSKRVSLITGLCTDYRDTLASAEPFQVVNYGMGGQYEPHVDFYTELMKASLPSYLVGTGDRSATFMFYLSEVEAGGATVFPLINVRVPPVKNAAAFWYNNFPSGEYTTLTHHAGCPVLLGQKWVANKWIRDYGQEFRRPCGLKQNDTDT